jgi:heme/copper-type cytochrome/quinol oxidase subunit 2
MRNAIEAAIRTAIYGSIAAAAGVAAFLFLVIAAFLWAQQHYDTIVACGVAGGLFLLVAVVALTVLAVSRRRTARAEEKAEEANSSSIPAWLADPATLLMALQIVRSVGLGRLVPLALAAITAFGAANLVKGPARANKRRTESGESKRAA